MRLGCFAGAVAILAVPLATSAQSNPDFSGTWILQAEKSGPSKVVWNQTRAQRFTIAHGSLEVTIDTGDGSLFGVREPVTSVPLIYKLGGSSVTVVDRSLGDLPGFSRKIRTEAKWDNAKLVTLTTHFSETAEDVGAAVTRALIFSLLAGGREMVVERTGYRDNTPSTIIPRIMHHGRMEDDLIYAKDIAFYIKSALR